MIQNAKCARKRKRESEGRKKDLKILVSYNKLKMSQNVSELINVKYPCVEFLEIHALTNSSDHKEDMVLSSKQSNLMITFINYKITR